MTSRFTIAIGDIHGMCRVLRPFLAKLTGQYAPADSKFIFLGDLIDRGPAGFRVMEDLCEFFDARPSSVLILGNHDEYLLDCLRGKMNADKAERWIWNGGDATLRGYAFYDSFTIEEVTDAINQAFPKHRQLLERAVSMVVTDRYCFVHAGIDPTKSLYQQEERTLRWIREGFLDHVGPFERIVVHGHSITPSGFPEIFSNRIALDSGSYQTGRISAAIFNDDNLVGFVCAEKAGEEMIFRYFDASMTETLPLAHLAGC